MFTCVRGVSLSVIMAAIENETVVNVLWLVLSAVHL